MFRRPPRSTRTASLFPYTTLFRSSCTLRLTVVLGRRRVLAAAMKLPCSTTLTKTRVSLRSRAMGCSELVPGHWPKRGRSEEHTSELQSLMRISYAVFCLKITNKYNLYCMYIKNHNPHLHIQHR